MSGQHPPGNGRPAVGRRGLLLATAVAILLVLRHDYWQWDAAAPLLFGWLPVGLWWQAGVSVLAAGLMWLLTRWAWPAELEGPVTPSERRPGGDEGPGERDERSSGAGGAR